MSSQIYPALIGLAFPVLRSYVWKTGVQEALSGKQSAISYRQYPLVHYELPYDIFRDDITTSDFKAIVGLHNQMQGRWDTFLFIDPDFNTIPSSSPQQFAIADGTAGPFQIVAYYQNVGGPGVGEIIQNFNTVPALYDNGTLIPTANYTLGVNGVITFNSGHFPTSGHAISWSGSFYYRCRFDEDAIEWKKFMNQWWKATVRFTSVKL